MTDVQLDEHEAGLDVADEVAFADTGRPWGAWVRRPAEAGER